MASALMAAALANVKVLLLSFYVMGKAMLGELSFIQTDLVSPPGQSPGRAIVLPPASTSALVKSLTLKFFM